MQQSILSLKRHPNWVGDSTYLKLWTERVRTSTKGGDDEHEDEWLQLVYTVLEYDVLHYDIPHMITTK